MTTITSRQPVRTYQTSLTERQIDNLHHTNAQLKTTNTVLKKDCSTLTRDLRVEKAAVTKLTKESADLRTRLNQLTQKHEADTKTVQQLHTSPHERNGTALSLDEDLPTLEKRLAPYFDLLDQYKDTLGPDGDAAKGEIQIIRDPQEIQRIQRETKQPVGILAQNKWQIWIADAVQFPSEADQPPKYGIYGRFVWKNTLENKGVSGAAILPYTEDGKILLISTYRHSTRCLQLELPRGCGESGEAVCNIIKRELHQETGAGTASETSILGHTSCDTGVLVGKNVLAKVMIEGYEEPDRDEAETSIRLHTFSIAELEAIIKAGSAVLKIDGEEKTVRCEDPFLLSALYLNGLNNPSEPSVAQQVYNLALSILKKIPIIRHSF